MKKILLSLFILFMPICLWSGGVLFMAGGVGSTQPPATPDWEYGFEDADACSNHFETVTGSPNCADSAQAAIGTYSMSIGTSIVETVKKDFTADTYSEVWLSFAVYYDSASMSVSTRRTLDIFSGTSGAKAYTIRFGTRNSTGLNWYIYNVGTASYTDSGVLPVGQTWNYIRVRFKVDNTTGAIQISRSDSKLSGYSTLIDLTDVDTQQLAGNYAVLMELGSAQSAAIENTYLDVFEVYYTDPGWSF